MSRHEQTWADVILLNAPLFVTLEKRESSWLTKWFDVIYHDFSMNHLVIIFFCSDSESESDLPCPPFKKFRELIWKSDDFSWSRYESLLKLRDHRWITSDYMWFVMITVWIAVNYDDCAWVSVKADDSHGTELRTGGFGLRGGIILYASFHNPLPPDP